MPFDEGAGLLFWPRSSSLEPLVVDRLVASSSRWLTRVRSLEVALEPSFALEAEDALAAPRESVALWPVALWPAGLWFESVVVPCADELELEFELVRSCARFSQSVRLVPVIDEQS